ncbi:MAG: thioredoxin family protein [Pelagibacteraceae bacterium]|jgi:peroxiredoxin|nr:MAG: thioredoxin family protein [alpha proteobacterium HIMB114]|tara:strand:+ start:350 stop:901 length:552 start_codon:yes stop_codon:yes gene_type:complete
MALEKTPLCNFGEQPKDFNLKGIDENKYSLKDVVGANGTLIMFICNHCPYVKAISKEIGETAAELKKYQINVVAIMSNDTLNYPDDSFDNMKIFAKQNNFMFPYLIDESQEVAKNFGAVCTPDFFGYNSKNELQYRGRLRQLKDLKPAINSKNELLEAMIEVSKSGRGPKEQFPSMGCNIKWK